MAYINKEGGIRSGSLCALLWRLLCWCNLRHVVLKARLSECDCRQVVSTRPNHEDRVVSSSGGFQPPGSDLAPSTGEHVCDKVQLQSSPTRVSSARPQCLGSGHCNSLLGEPGHVCLSPSVVARQGQQTIRPSLQESDLNSSGLAQHAMVFGPGGTVIPDPSLPTESSRLSDTAIQQGLSQGSDQPKPPCIDPRAEAMKEQGFSSPVAS